MKLIKVSKEFAEANPNISYPFVGTRIPESIQGWSTISQFKELYYRKNNEWKSWLIPLYKMSKLGRIFYQENINVNENSKT